MFLPTSTVGRKLTMAVTGQFMIFYVIAHVIGNSTIYAHAINAYAEGLHHWPFTIILWSSRTILFFSVLIHIYYGTVLKLENRKSKPEPYSVTNYRTASFAGRTMFWTGLIILLYLIFHLLHFTFQVIEPSSGAIAHPDSLGRPDVFAMVISSFRHIGMVAVYVIGVLALGLHLLHGMESSIQTEGLNNAKSLPIVVNIGRVAAIVLFLAYATIPLAILLGLVK